MSILVAVDVEHAPEQPITVAYDLAITYDESLVALYVLPESTYSDWQKDAAELPEEFQQQTFFVDRAIEYAADLVTDTVEDTLDAYERDRIEPLGRVGTPSHEIQLVAAETDPRFVVVGGRRRSPVTQSLFGSVSHEVMRHTTQPVVTIMEP